MIALSNRIRIVVISLFACFAIAATALCADNAVSVSGKVTLSDGKPAAGANVMALSPWANPKLVAQTVASTEGVYTLQLPPGVYKIDATYGTLAGFTSFELNASGSTTRTLDVKLGKGCMLMGLLTDKITGQLIPDAAITLDRVETVSTSSNGTFSALVPADGPVDIDVAKEGYAKRWIRFNPNGQDVAAIKFETRPEGILTGVVTDEQGNPVPNASVGSTQTDAQGRYTLRGLDPDDPREINALADGFQYTSGKAIAFAPGSNQATCDFVLRRYDKRTLTGRVTRADGSPVKGASLVCARGSAYLDKRSGVTDENGCYTITDVNSGKEVLLARASGCAPTFAAVPEKGDATIDMVLEPGHVLEGRVVNSAGKPVVGEGLVINALCDPLDNIFLGSSGHMLYRSLVGRLSTDQNGCFKVTDMPAGNVHIETFFEGYARIDDLAVPVDSKDLVITLKDPGKFTGRVVSDVDGKPITTFAVSTSHGLVPSIFNSPDGTFTISSSLYAPGTKLDVAVNAAGYRQCAISGIDIEAKSQPGQEPIEFRLKPAEPLTGRITDTAGNPIEGAQITVLDTSIFGAINEWRYVTSPRGPNRVTARTDADGRFTTDPVPFASATIAIYCQGYGRRMIQGHIISRPLQVTLDKAATIIAQIADASGKVPNDSYVSVRCRTTSTDMDLFYPDVQGRVTISDLAPGLYTISADNAGRARVQNIQVEAGKTYTVDWNRKLPVVVKGMFTVKGQPFAKARILVHDTEGEIAASGETDENGGYSLSVNEPGHYSITCSKGEWTAPDYTESRLDMDLKDGVNEVSGVVPAGSISGVLVDKSTGKPLGDTSVSAQIWLTHPPLRRMNYHFSEATPFWFPEEVAKTDADGRFTLPNMEAGDWLITARVNTGDHESTLPGQKITLKPDEIKTDLSVQVDPSNTGCASVVITSPSGAVINDALGFILSCRSEQGLGYYPSAEPRNGSESYTLKKGQDGGTLFESLPAGHYKLFVPATIYGPDKQQLLFAKAEFDVTPGVTTSVRVTLRQGPAIVFRLSPAALDKFGGSLIVGYKISKAGSGEYVSEDCLGPNWGGIAYFRDRSERGPSAAQSPAVLPLEPGEYALEAVLRYEQNNMGVDDTRADLWSIKTKIRLAPGKDAVIDIEPPTQ